MRTASRIFFGRVVPSLAVLAAAGVTGMFGLELIRARAEREVYRDRLQSLSTDYKVLSDRYNDAVRRTAVTELVVKEGALSVAVRTARGEVERIDTPYDPKGEIYVDFALIDGRVWIRRVFDAQTPPMFATVVDPSIAEIDWDEGGARYGKAVYRSLSEGRWVVTVSGSGAIELARASDQQTPIALAAPPRVMEFSEVEAQAERESDKIGWRELLARVFGG